MDYHHLSHSEIGGDKRISQHLSNFLPGFTEDYFRDADNAGPVSLSRWNQDGNGGTSTERRVISQVGFFPVSKVGRTTLSHSVP